MDLLFDPSETSESGNAQSDTRGTSRLFTSDADTPNLLFERVRELKRKINHRHDQLTSRLPLELIISIFGLIVDERHEEQWYDDGEWHPVVMLGAVCRRWREITLDTPQLWTNFLITATNLKYASFSNIITERLSRSRSLPLSLVVIGHDTHISFPVLSYSNIVPILRSEVHRWKDLEIQGTMSILHVLLTGLEDELNVDSLVIHLDDPDPDTLDKIAMEYPFTPRRLDIKKILLPQIPIQWGALTHLSAVYISVDDVLDVFRHAQNLEYCRLYVVVDDEEPYPLPTSPITNVSIKQLETDTQGDESDIGIILSHSTLPSLETFNYAIDNRDLDCTEEIKRLANFLNRSKAPLRNFSFSYADIEVDWKFKTDWYPVLPHITSLELHVSETHDNGERMQAHLERLGPHAESTVLPRLRELKIHTDIMSPRSWTALSAMFPDHENEKDSARPLNTVKIYLDKPSEFDKETMPEATYSRLCAIRKSGVKIQVFGDLQDKIEILGPWDLGPAGHDALLSAYCLLSDEEEEEEE